LGATLWWVGVATRVGVGLPTILVSEMTVGGPATPK